MSTHAELGMNKTGIATSPKLTAAMVEGQKEFAPDMPGDEALIAAARTATALEWNQQVGSVPPPTTLKGVVKTGMTAMKGESPTLLIDKLGARLAYERSGVRLYEALLSKFDANGAFEGGPTRALIEGILNDEYNHFKLLTEALVHLGADPTVMTPTADLEANITQGALAVMVEPRTNFVQCLEAVMTIELIDNACWESLVELAQQAGQRDLAARFEAALREENAHLANVKRWLAVSQGITKS